MSHHINGFWKLAKRKNKLRMYIAKSFEQTQPKVSLFLPGIDIACIKTIWEGGHVHSKMKIILVERNPKIMQEIKEKVLKLSKQLHQQCTFHTGELHDLILNYKIEFSYIDLLGNITLDLYQWFTDQYLKNVSPTCVTFLTVQKAYRGNTFMRAWRNYIWNVDAELKKIFYSYREDQKRKHPEIKQSFYNRKVPYTLWLLDGMFRQTRKQHVYKNILQYKDIKDGTMACTMLLIKIKLKTKATSVNIPDMSKIDLDHMIKCLESRPVVSIKSLKRKLAGQKAAYTRAIRNGNTTKLKLYKININRLQRFLAKSAK
jgi:hypothetical protein